MHDHKLPLLVKNIVHPHGLGRTGHNRKWHVIGLGRNAHNRKWHVIGLGGIGHNKKWAVIGLGGIGHNRKWDVCFFFEDMRFCCFICLLGVSWAAPPPLAACPVSEWIDPDTPADACIGKTDLKGRALELVFSDEFEVPGRTFTDGHDPLWTALVGHPNTNSQVSAYSDLPDFATTADGRLKLKADVRTSTVHSAQYFEGGLKAAVRRYTTSMLQGWNKFCFTEGVVGVKVKLPGRAAQPGLWPAAWIFGNLGRATFQETTQHVLRQRLWSATFSLVIPARLISQPIQCAKGRWNTCSPTGTIRIMSTMACSQRCARCRPISTWST